MAAKAEEFKLSDFCRPLPFVRSESEMVYTEKEGGLQAPSSSMTKKKLLNIPICDVVVDEEYDNYVSPTFVAWPSYVKHVRRIGDESDVTSDYLIEDADLGWLDEFNRKFPHDRLTHDKYEAIINLFERANSSSSTNINQAGAIKLLHEKLGYELVQCYRIAADLYKHWVQKRDRIGKSLCRRYWPLVPATDTNPYQVFRVRDRERYRLRRQQKRNDVESFRRMQQLKKEFSKAATILQLMLEREKLSEAAFKVQRQMFDLQVSALSEAEGSASSQKVAVESLVAYLPQSQHLWDVETPPMPDLDAKEMEIEEVEELASNTGTAISGTTNGCPPTTSLKKGVKAAGPKAVEPSSSSISDGKKTSSTTATERKKRVHNHAANTHSHHSNGNNNNGGNSGATVKDRMVFYAMNNGAVQVVDSEDIKAAGVDVAASTKMAASALQGTLGFTQPSIMEVDAVRSTSIAAALAAAASGTEEVKIIHEDLAGPRYVCMPKWPSFLQTQSMDVPGSRGCSDYLDALEYRYDSNLAPILPSKYRVAARVGRGGRVVMDRFPVYGAELEAIEEKANALAGAAAGLAPLPTHLHIPTQPVGKIYQYATQLRTAGQPVRPSAATSSVSVSVPKTALLAAHKQQHGLPPAAMGSLLYEGSVNGEGSVLNGENTRVVKPAKDLPELPLSNKKIVFNMKKAGRSVSSNHLWASTNVLQFQSIPPLQPPGRLPISADKAKKLQQILAEGDSEDEKVVVLKHPRLDDIDRVQHSRSQVSEQSLTKFTLCL